MGAFKKLKLGRLPRVMVKIGALDERDRIELVEAVERSLGVTSMKGTSVDVGSMPGVFAKVLDLPKDERRAFCVKFNHELDGVGDLFGTEGQCDPRGDRRG